MAVRRGPSAGLWLSCAIAIALISTTWGLASEPKGGFGFHPGDSPDNQAALVESQNEDAAAQMYGNDEGMSEQRAAPARYHRGQGGARKDKAPSAEMNIFGLGKNALEGVFATPPDVGNRNVKQGTVEGQPFSGVDMYGMKEDSEEAAAAASMYSGQFGLMGYGGVDMPKHSRTKYTADLSERVYGPSMVEMGAYSPSLSSRKEDGVGAREKKPSMSMSNMPAWMDGSANADSVVAGREAMPYMDWNGIMAAPNTPPLTDEQNAAAMAEVEREVNGEAQAAYQGYPEDSQYSQQGGIYSQEQQRIQNEQRLQLQQQAQQRRRQEEQQLQMQQTQRMGQPSPASTAAPPAPQAAPVEPSAPALPLASSEPPSAEVSPAAQKSGAGSGPAPTPTTATAASAQAAASMTEARGPIEKVGKDSDSAAAAAAAAAAASTPVSSSASQASGSASSADSSPGSKIVVDPSTVLPATPEGPGADSTASKGAAPAVKQTHSGDSRATGAAVNLPSTMEMNEHKSLHMNVAKSKQMLSTIDEIANTLDALTKRLNMSKDVKMIRKRMAAAAKRRKAAHGAKKVTGE